MKTLIKDSNGEFFSLSYRPGVQSLFDSINGTTGYKTASSDKLLIDGKQLGFGSEHAKVTDISGAEIEGLITSPAIALSDSISGGPSIFGSTVNRPKASPRGGYITKTSALTGELNGDFAMISGTNKFAMAVTSWGCKVAYLKQNLKDTTEADILNDIEEEVFVGDKARHYIKEISNTEYRGNVVDEKGRAVLKIPVKSMSIRRVGKSWRDII